MGSRMAPKLCRWWWCVCGGGGGQTLDDAGRKQAIKMADQMCPSSLPACLGQQAPVEPVLGKRLVLLEVRRRKVPVPPSVHAAGAAPHAGAVLAGLGQHRQEVFLRNSSAIKGGKVLKHERHMSGMSLLARRLPDLPQSVLHAAEVRLLVELGGHELDGHLLSLVRCNVWWCSGCRGQMRGDTCVCGWKVAVVGGWGWVGGGWGWGWGGWGGGARGQKSAPPQRTFLMRLATLSSTRQPRTLRRTRKACCTPPPPPAPCCWLSNSAAKVASSRVDRITSMNAPRVPAGRTGSSHLLV